VLGIRVESRRLKVRESGQNREASKWGKVEEWTVPHHASNPCPNALEGKKFALIRRYKRLERVGMPCILWGLRE